MKRSSLSLLALLPLAAVVLQPHAQTGKSKVGFVNAQTVVASMAGGASYVALSKKADANRLAQQKALQPLLTKAQGAGASAADRAAYTAAAKKAQAALASDNTQLQKAFAPLASKVNSTVAAVAKANGYSLVLDKRVAASGLVVYADQATDLTAAVVQKLK